MQYQPRPVLAVGVTSLETGYTRKWACAGHPNLPSMQLLPPPLVEVQQISVVSAISCVAVCMRNKWADKGARADTRWPCSWQGRAAPQPLHVDPERGVHLPSHSAALVFLIHAVRIWPIAFGREIISLRELRKSEGFRCGFGTDTPYWEIWLPAWTPVSCSRSWLCHLLKVIAKSRWFLCILRCSII